MARLRKTETLVAAALAACAVLLYTRALGYEYVWDDLMYLSGFDYYRGVEGVVRAVAEPFFLYPSYYRPLAMLSFAASAESWVQHGINAVLHALNTALVFYVAQALMPRAATASRGGVAAAALGALLFAVHPVAVESTAWVSGRFDTLMSTFVLGTSLVVLGGELTHRRLALACVLFFAAMSSKEAAIGLPVALPCLLLLKWRLAGKETGVKEKARQLLPLLAALALGAALYIAMRLAVIQRLLADEGTAVTFAGGGVVDKLNIAALAVTEFAKLLTNPWSHSAPLHPFSYEAGSGLLPQTLLVAAVVFALLAAFFLKKPRLNFPLALLAGLGMLWPVLHLLGLPNGENIISDRYALAPLALLLCGLAAAAGAWQAQRAPTMNTGEKRAQAYAGVFVLLWAGALAAHTNVTIPMWRSEYVLWGFAHRQAPESTLAYRRYISTLISQERWHEADEELKKFFESHKNTLKIEDVTNMMLVSAKTGNYEGAVELFEMFDAAALKESRKRALGTFYGVRAIIEQDEGHWDLAAHYLGKAVQASPEDIKLAFHHAHALFMTGQGALADEMFERALAKAHSEMRKEAIEWRKGWQSLKE